MSEAETKEPMYTVITRPDDHYDIAIVGGGFAGAFAARRLTDAGLRVVIVEARDRLSGRMWTQPDFFDGRAVEWGGAFMLDRDSYPLAWAEIDKFGLELDWGSTEPTELIWLSGGERRTGVMPVPLDELASLERLVLRINELAAQIDLNRPIHEQDVAALDVPWPGLLKDVDLGPHTRELMRAHIVTLSGDAWEIPSALPLLHTIARSGSVSAATFFAAPYNTPMARTLGPQLAEGTAALHQAIMSEVDADVLLGTMVTAVEVGDDHATVRTTAGVIRADAVICALAIGAFSGIEFTPPLSPELQHLTEQGVTGQAEKATVFVSNCPQPFYGHGIPPEGGFATASTTYHEGDRATVIGFTSEPHVIDLNDVDAVQVALQHYVPGIVVDAVAWYDWTGDALSRGTWTYLRPGQTAIRPAARRPGTRIAFAGSDFDPRLGVEGALYTAGLAADEALAMLDH
jgi:monoamine oxidase